MQTSESSPIRAVDDDDDDDDKHDEYDEHSAVMTDPLWEFTQIIWRMCNSAKWLPTLRQSLGYCRLLLAILTDLNKEGFQEQLAYVVDIFKALNDLNRKMQWS